MSEKVNPVGRPTLYREEFCEIARKTLAKGFSLAGVAAELGICRDTVHRWMNENENFSDSIKQGKALGQQWFEKIMLAKVAGQKIKGFDNKLSDTTMCIFAMKTRFYRDYGVKDRVEIIADKPLVLNYMMTRDSED